MKNTSLVFIIFLCFLCFFECRATTTRKIFYVLRKNDGEILKTQHKNIDVIIAQSYFINKNGLIDGRINTKILALSHRYRIKFTAMLTNAGFNTKLIHKFLMSNKLQQKAIQDLLKKCQIYQLSGIQIDFEHIDVKDKNALTDFVRKAAKVFHKAHLEISIAVIPRAFMPPPTPYLKLQYEKWSGAFDFSALAKICDYITLMTYDQHVNLSTPGPVASYLWLKKIITISLKEIPLKKISIGIPTYSDYWRMKSINFCNKSSLFFVSAGEQISYKSVEKLIKKYNIKLHWSNKDKVYYAMFDPYFIYRYLFIEDARSFQEKLNLIKQFNLTSISIFSLGNEDPKIWKLLSSY